MKAMFCFGVVAGNKGSERQAVAQTDDTSSSSHASVWLLYATTSPAEGLRLAVFSFWMRLTDVLKWFPPVTTSANVWNKASPVKSQLANQNAPLCERMRRRSGCQMSGDVLRTRVGSRDVLLIAFCYPEV